MKDKKARTCNQCHKEMKLSVAIENTNIAFPVIVDKPLYENDDQIMSVCDNPKCPNYGLMQISIEQMPVT